MYVIYGLTPYIFSNRVTQLSSCVRPIIAYCCCELPRTLPPLGNWAAHAFDGSRWAGWRFERTYSARHIFQTRAAAPWPHPDGDDSRLVRCLSCRRSDAGAAHYCYLPIQRRVSRRNCCHDQRSELCRRRHRGDRWQGCDQRAGEQFKLNFCYDSFGRPRCSTSCRDKP